VGAQHCTTTRAPTPKGKLHLCNFINTNGWLAGAFQVAQVKVVPLIATFSIYRLLIAQCMHPYCSVIFLLLMSNTELLGDLVNHLVYTYLGRPCSPTSKDVIILTTMMLMILLPRVTLGAHLMSSEAVHIVILALICSLALLHL